MGKPENEDNRVFKLVYDATARVLRELCGPFLDALRRLKANGVDREGFGEEFDRLVHRVLFTPLDRPPLSAMMVRGADPRRTFLFEIFRGIGTAEAEASYYADMLMKLRTVYGEDGKLKVPDPDEPNASPIAAELKRWRSDNFRSARLTFERVKGLELEVAKPYVGTTSDPQPGIAQTVALLRRFPDLADRVYAMVGFNGLRGVPPRGACNVAEARFQRVFEKEVQRKQTWELIETVGLVVVSIAMTVLSLGVLSPAAAMLLGAGLGLAQGGVLIVKANTAVQEGRVGNIVGAVRDERLRYLENELGAAWAAALIDVVTLGLSTRFGAGKIGHATVRVMGISGAGGGLSAALNPNVWADKDRLALILEGVFWNAAGAGGGMVIGSATIRAGHKMTLLFERGSGALAPGSRVKWKADGADKVEEGTILNIDKESVTVKTSDGRQFVVRVDKVKELRASETPPGKTLQRATEPNPLQIYKTSEVLAPDERLLRTQLEMRGRPKPEKTQSVANLDHGLSGEPHGMFLYRGKEWPRLSKPATDPEGGWVEAGMRWYETTPAELLRSYPGGRFVVDPANPGAAVVFVTPRDQPVLPFAMRDFAPGNAASRAMKPPEGLVDIEKELERERRRLMGR